MSSFIIDTIYLVRLRAHCMDSCMATSKHAWISLGMGITGSAIQLVDNHT